MAHICRYDHAGFQGVRSPAGFQDVASVWPVHIHAVLAAPQSHGEGESEAPGWQGAAATATASWLPQRSSHKGFCVRPPEGRGAPNPPVGAELPPSNGHTEAFFQKKFQRPRTLTPKPLSRDLPWEWAKPTRPSPALISPRGEGPLSWTDACS